jgi:hypothetical protein
VIYEDHIEREMLQKEIEYCLKLSDSETPHHRRMTAPRPLNGGCAFCTTGGLH